MSTQHEHNRSSHLQHEAEHAKPRKKVSVMSYLVILFGAAFLLLLMSYLMQQRTNEAAQSALKDTSHSALQSIEKMLADNKNLTTAVDELEQQLEALTTENAALDRDQRTQADANTKLSAQLEAMDWFWRIQRSFSRGAKQEALGLTTQFEATGLPASLPTSPLSGVEGPSPAEQYNALLEAMDLKTATAP